MEFVRPTLAMNEETEDCDREESNFNAIIRKCDEMATNDDIGYSEATNEFSLFQQTLGDSLAHRTNRRTALPRAIIMGLNHLVAGRGAAAIHNFKIAAVIIIAHVAEWAADRMWVYAMKALEQTQLEPQPNTDN